MITDKCIPKTQDVTRPYSRRHVKSRKESNFLSSHVYLHPECLPSTHELSCKNNHVGRISYMNDTYVYIVISHTYVYTYVTYDLVIGSHNFSLKIQHHCTDNLCLRSTTQTGKLMHTQHHMYC